VKDSEGLTGTTFVDVLPQKVHLTFLTDPPGLQILLDGTPRTAPFTEEAVVGLLRTIGVVPQANREPVSWSDGGAAVHEITTPAADTTYTAVFQATETHGLMATYFDDRSFSQPVLTRIDPNVDFQWGQGSPARNIGKDTFSVRWTGKVEATASGPHNFLVRADNDARLWIDGKPLQNRGTIQLEAGKRYDLRLEYFENRGAAMVQLLWSAPGLRRQTVPESQLTP
jgi:PA14 domain